MDCQLFKMRLMQQEPIAARANCRGATKAKFLWSAAFPKASLHWLRARPLHEENFGISACFAILPHLWSGNILWPATIRVESYLLIPVLETISVHWLRARPLHEENFGISACFDFAPSVKWQHTLACYDTRRELLVDPCSGDYCCCSKVWSLVECAETHGTNIGACWKIYFSVSARLLLFEGWNCRNNRLMDARLYVHISVACLLKFKNLPEEAGTVTSAPFTVVWAEHLVKTTNGLITSTKSSPALGRGDKWESSASIAAFVRLRLFRHWPWQARTSKTSIFITFWPRVSISIILSNPHEQVTIHTHRIYEAWAWCRLLAQKLV